MKWKKYVIGIFIIMLIGLSGSFLIQGIKDKRQKEELLNHYNQVCLEIEQEEDSGAIIGYLPEIVNHLMPVLKDEDYIEVLKNNEYCCYFKFLMMDLYANQRTEPKTEEYENVLFEIVKDKKIVKRTKE